MTASAKTEPRSSTEEGWTDNRGRTAETSSWKTCPGPFCTQRVSEAFTIRETRLRGVCVYIIIANLAMYRPEDGAGRRSRAPKPRVRVITWCTLGFGLGSGKTQWDGDANGKSHRGSCVNRRRRRWVGYRCAAYRSDSGSVEPVTRAQSNRVCRTGWNGVWQTPGDKRRQCNANASRIMTRDVRTQLYTVLRGIRYTNWFIFQFQLLQIKYDQNLISINFS